MKSSPRVMEGRRKVLALLLVVGPVILPPGVILQTLDRGIIAQAAAALGADLVITALAGIAPGFARSERD